MTVEKPVRATVAFTQEEFEEFVECGIGWKIVQNEMFDSGRWSIIYDMVIRRLEDDTFWRGRYQVGATERQEYDWGARWGDDRACFKQVFPEEKTIIVYV